MPLRPYLSLFMIVPDDGGFDSGELEEMVREINATQVAPEEVLSDHIYYYNCGEGRLLVNGAEETGKEGGR